MSSKPIATVQPGTKELNKDGSGKRFKFRGLAERVARVDVNFAHRIRTVELDPGKGFHATFFLDTFEKWQELDLTTCFADFIRGVYAYVKSLPLLLRHKEKVVGLILHHLQLAESTSLPALLELLSTLARDLKEEFYPLLAPVMKVLTGLIDPEAPEDLERIFGCFSVMFKFLLKCLLDDIEAVFRSYYGALLAHPRDFVRRFAAETFAFLLRKLPQAKFEKVLTIITSLHAEAEDLQLSKTVVVSTSDSPDGDDADDQTEVTEPLPALDVQSERFCDGLAWTLFYVAKGVQQRFHSKLSWVLPLYLDSVGPLREGAGKDAEDKVQHRQSVLLMTMRRMANYARREHCTLFWSLLLGHATRLLEEWPTAKTPRDSAAIGRILGFVDVWIQHRGGSRILSMDNVVSLVTKALHPSLLHDEAHDTGFIASGVACLASVWTLPKQTPKVRSSLSSLLPGAFGIPHAHLSAIRTLLMRLRDEASFVGLARHHAAALVQSLLVEAESQPLSSSTVADGVCVMLELVGQHEKSNMKQEEKDENEFPPSLAAEPWNLIAAPDQIRFISSSHSSSTSSSSSSSSSSSPVSALLSLFSKAVKSFQSDPHTWLEPNANPSPGLLWGLLHILPRSTSPPSPYHSPTVLKQLHGLSQFISELVLEASPARALREGDVRRLLFLRSQADISRVHLARAMDARFEATAEWPHMLALLKAYPTEPAVLRSTAVFLDYIKDDGATSTASAEPKKGTKNKKLQSKNVISEDALGEIFSKATLTELLDLVAPGLSSSSVIIRRLSCSVLIALPCLPYVINEQNTKSELRGDCDILKTMEQTLRFTPNIKFEKNIGSGVLQVQTVLNSTRMPVQYAQVVPYFYLGLLRTKFSPIWKAVSTALSSMASSHGKILWPIFAASIDLTRAPEKPRLESLEDDGEAEEDVGAGVDAQVQLSRGMEMWSLEKVRATDSRTFFKLLLECASNEQGMMTLANKHAAEMATQFAAFMELYDARKRGIDTKAMGVFAGVSAGEQRERLLLWMRMIGASWSPQSIAKLEGREQLRYRCMEWLADTESEFQRASLDILAKFNLPYLNPYKDNLLRLIEDKSSRDEMLSFHLDPSRGIINHEHRQGLVPIVVRTVFPKLVKRKGAKSKQLGALRSAALAFLSGLSSEELQHLLVIMLGAFDGVLNGALDSDVLPMSTINNEGDSEKEARVRRVLSIPMTDLDVRTIAYQEGAREVAATKQLGILKVLGVAHKHLKMGLEPYLAHLLALLLNLLRQSESDLRSVASVIEDDGEEDEDNEDDEEDEEGEEGSSALVTKSEGGYEDKRRQKAQKSVRQLCLQRLAAFFNAYPEVLAGPCRSSVELFIEIAAPSLDAASIESTQHRGGLLNAVVAMSTHAELVPIMVEHHASLLPPLLKMIGAPKVSQSVVHAVLELLENLLGYGEAEAKEAPLGLPEGFSRKRKRVDSDEDSEDEGDNGEEEEDDTERRIQVAAVKTTVDGLWVQYVPLFLDGMYEYLQTVLRVEKRDAKGRIVRTFPRRELELLAKLSKYTTKGEMGQKLVDLLLPFLASGKGSRGFPAARSSILLIIREMVPKLDEPRRVVSFLSRQFLILTDAKDRLTLVGIFQAIGQRLPDLESVGDILAGLNAMEAGRVASADYGKRMDAYELLNNRFLEEWDATQLNPVLHSIVSDLRQEEMGLRMASSHALITTIQKLALEPAAAPSDGPPSTNDKVFLLHSVLFPALKNGLKTSEEPSRRETVKVLAALVRAFPVHYHHLLPLTHVNPDLDFFENILHIQMHRRRKALQRLRITLGGTVSKADAAAANADPSADPAPEDEGDDDADNAMVVDAAPTGPCTIDSTAATHVLIPLVQLCCFQATEQALVTEAVMTLGALAGLLGWSAYNNLVTSTIVRIRLKPEMEKVLIRVLCAVVDHFSFDLTMDAELVTAVVVVKEVPVTAMVIKGDDEDDEEELEDVTGQEDSKGEQAVKNRDALAAKIRAAIGKNLIPQLRDLISPKREGEEVGDVKETGGKKLVVPKHGKSQDAAPMIRVPVAMALIKLVKKLPEDLIQIHLPRLLTVLVKQLASRNQTARDVTRNTLVSMLETMGPKYLWFMLTEMHEILTRGYQLHVLGYVVHSLLFSLTNTKAVTGCVSASLNLLTRILMQDLVGETGKEKDVEKIKSSMREGRVLAPDSFEMLAALVDFGRDVDGLLDPLKEALAEAQGLTAVRHLTATLSRVAIGLQLNSSVTPETLLVFLHGTMTGAMSNGEVEVAAKTGGDGQAMSKVEMKARLRVTKEQTMMVQKMPKKDSARDPRRNQHTLIIFALQLLHTCFKRNRFEVQAAHILGMLDPFVGVIVDGLLQIGVEPPKAGAKEKSLRAASQGVITASLKALCYLLRTPLPSVAGMVPGLTGFLFELLRYGDQSLLHACCQCMAAVLRHCPTLELADEQVRLLLGFVQQEMANAAKQAVVFGVLKACLARRYVLPEVYDVMDKVGGLLVQSPSIPVRQQCASVLLQFLLDYPLGQKRLRQHLGFLLNNLQYPYPATREVVIELLHAVVTKFPVEVLDAHAEFLLLPTVLALVQDTSAKCRTMLSAVVKVLLGKISAGPRGKLVALCFQWYKPTSAAQLRRAGAQVLGLAIEALGDGFQKHLPAFLASLVACLEAEGVADEKAMTMLGIGQEKEAEAAEDEGDEGEEGEENDEKEEEEGEEGTGVEGDTQGWKEGWKLVYYSLGALEKLLAAYPTGLGSQDKGVRVWQLVNVSSLHPCSWVRIVASRVVGAYLSQLDPSAFADPTYVKGTLIKQPTQLFELSRLSARQLSFVKSESNQLGEQVVKNILFLALSMYHVGRTAEDEERNAGLNWLYKRMSFMSRKGSDARRECVFRWFAAMVQAVDKPKELAPYLPAMLHPLHRVSTTQQGNMGALATEVMDVVKNGVGTELFLPAYSLVREKVGQVRDQRRKDRKQLAVQAPDAAAARKIAKNVNKRKSVKRKMDEQRLRPKGKKKKV